MVVRVLIDADAIIKLHQSGLLAVVVGAFPCTIPQAVYEEVVTRGKARLHQDAEAIERIIAGAVTVVRTRERQQPETGLGAGELGILDLLATEKDTTVVSDDRRFLSLLSTQGTLFLTPADMLVVLTRRGVITKVEAREALERLRPLIRVTAYHDAWQDLELGGKR
ncbi:MAG: hypothetical protein HY683_08510 [Chloroflexi bacterium]|nr:hypothetical protein [Chloroflexota bacterium]